jgi:hypothetical protein
MDERKDGIWLGGAAVWRNDIANLSAELLGDASGNSKGSKFKLTVDRRFQAGIVRHHARAWPPRGWTTNTCRTTTA